MENALTRRNESILENGIELFSNASSFTDQFTESTFISLTETMLKKSIMDAVDPLRNLLRNADIHDFDEQEQGPEFKVLLPTILIGYSETQGVVRIETTTSLYRPVTKQGDPRLWVRGMKEVSQVGDFMGFALAPLTLAITDSL